MTRGGSQVRVLYRPRTTSSGYGAAMGLLDGERAFVTGGASGIGGATCRRMAAEGARVAVVDIDQDRAEAIARSLDGIPYAVDATDFEAPDRAARDAHKQLCGLTLLYN